MSKTLTNARGEYVDLVNEVVRTRTTLSGTVKFQVYNLLKSKKEVIKIQKASEVFELATDSEDVVIVFIYETAFDKVDRQTAEIWIENALSQVKYDYDKAKVTIGGEPTISVPLGMYHHYKDIIIQKLELAALTLQQIADEEKDAKDKNGKKKKR